MAVVGINNSVVHGRAFHLIGPKAHALPTQNPMYSALSFLLSLTLTLTLMNFTADGIALYASGVHRTLDSAHIFTAAQHSAVTVSRPGGLGDGLD